MPPIPRAPQALEPPEGPEPRGPARDLEVSRATLYRRIRALPMPTTIRAGAVPGTGGAPGACRSLVTDAPLTDRGGAVGWASSGHQARPAAGRREEDWCTMPSALEYGRRSRSQMETEPIRIVIDGQVFSVTFHPGTTGEYDVDRLDSPIRYGFTSAGVPTSRGRDGRGRPECLGRHRPGRWFPGLTRREPPGIDPRPAPRTRSP